MLVRARLSGPSAVTPAVMSKSTVALTLTAPWVASTGPSIAGRPVLYVMVVSDHVLLVIALTVPPAALASALAEPAVRRRIAFCTLKLPMPVGAKRRNAWRTGALPASMLVVVPNLVVVAAEST